MERFSIGCGKLSGALSICMKTGENFHQKEQCDNIFPQTKWNGTSRACSFCTGLTLFLRKHGFYSFNNKNETWLAKNAYFIMEHYACGISKRTLLRVSDLETESEVT